MTTDEMQFQRELLSYNEKIALSRLEQSKASERVKELIYEKARFKLEFFLTQMKKNDHPM